LTITDSTISRNVSGHGGAAGVGTSAPFPGFAGPGGGVLAGTGGSISFTTLAGNSTGSSPAGAAGALSATAPVTVSSSLFAGNTGISGISQCSGSVTDGGHNLISEASDTSGCPASIPVGDPHLGPLANNGGTTETMALPVGSPALDQVPAGAPGCSGTDQRGIARPQGSACDIGAFELAVAAPVIPPPKKCAKTKAGKASSAKKKKKKKSCPKKKKKKHKK
jgi:hypothetical protein